jgi:hypothetical protein
MNTLSGMLCGMALLVATTIFAQPDKKTPAVTVREAKEGRAVVLKDNGAGGIYSDMTDSSNTVLFEYNFTAAQVNGIADDEYKEIIGFNIVPDKTGRFVLSGDQLKSANAYFYKGCFCMDRGSWPVTGGTVRGTKMSKTTWYINAELQVSSRMGDQPVTHTKKIKGIFRIVPGR